MGGTPCVTGTVDSLLDPRRQFHSIIGPKRVNLIFLFTRQLETVIGTVTEHVEFLLLQNFK